MWNRLEVEVVTAIVRALVQVRRRCLILVLYTMNHSHMTTGMLDSSDEKAWSVLQFT